VTTRYAAGSYLHRRLADEEACKKIALEWLADKSVGSRAQAVVMAQDLRLTEAVPMLVEIIESPNKHASETRAALYALSVLKPTGVADKILKLIPTAAGQSVEIRSVALGAVNRLDLTDAEREALRKTLVAMLKDRSTGKVLRMRAVQELTSDAYNTPETVEAVESVLFSDDEPHPVQRECLGRAAKFGGHERIKELLHDRRVYNHPYTFIRHDVSVGLQAMQMRDKLTFDILCDYLVDESPDDSQHIVRQDAWLSLWLLTGIVHGIQESDLFRTTPRYSERAADVDDVFRFGKRSGVSPMMRNAVMAHVADLEKMKATRQVLQDKWPEVQARWEKQREEAAKKRKAREDAQKAFEEKSKKAKDAATKDEKGEAGKDGTDKEPRENSAPGNKDND